MEPPELPADLPAGYIRRPPARSGRGAGRGGGRGRAAAAPAAERAAVAAAVALAAASSDESDEEEEQRELAALLQKHQHIARPRRPLPSIPPHFRGLARDTGRPWQRAEIRRLLAAAGAPSSSSSGGATGDDDDENNPKPSLYPQMAAPRLKRVLDARVAIESDARRLLEEARWQRERAEGWARLALEAAAAAAAAQDGDDGDDSAAKTARLPGGVRLLDFTVCTGLAEVSNLASECGAAEARLAALARAARAYRDADYSGAHAPSVAAALAAVRRFCAHYRERTVPALKRALEWAAEVARQGQERGAVSAGGGRGGRGAPRTYSPLSSSPPPLPAGWLPPPLPRAEQAVQWRYPPADYVVFRRKGIPGQRSREHPVPPAMRARAEQAAREASRRAARKMLLAGGGSGGGGGEAGGGLFD
jgi:hypothetical protein